MYLLPHLIHVLGLQRCAACERHRLVLVLRFALSDLVLDWMARQPNPIHDLIPGILIILILTMCSGGGGDSSMGTITMLPLPKPLLPPPPPLLRLPPPLLPPPPLLLPPPLPLPPDTECIPISMVPLDECAVYAVIVTVAISTLLDESHSQVLIPVVHSMEHSMKPSMEHSMNTSVQHSMKHAIEYLTKYSMECLMRHSIL